MGITHLLFVVLWLAVFMYPLWRIVGKAGFHPAFSLLSLVPLVNIVFLWIFAFAKWPNGRPDA
jgi:membrane associated rhomboid family serine protease